MSFESISDENVVVEEVKEYRYLSIFNLIFMPFLIILWFLAFPLIPLKAPPALMFTIQIPITVWFSTITVQSIFSLIFYTKRPSIYYGMWKRKKKDEKIYSRDIITGRRIQKFIFIPAVCVQVIYLITTFYNLTLYL